MKSRSTIKSTNNSNSFLSSGPNIIHPTKLKRKIFPQNDNFTDLIRNFSKTSKQGNENLTSLLSVRDEMINKISKMEGELIRNNDLISNERQQLKIFGGERLLNEPDSETESEQEKSQNYYQNYNSAQSDEQATSKAIQSCTILNPFVSCFNDSIQKEFSEDNKNNLIKSNEENNQIESPINSDFYPNFRQFFLILKSLDEESYNNFMKASFSQLNWISECFEIYQEMQKYVESEFFIENFQNFTEKLFFAEHEDVKLFVFDPKSDEYAAFNENNTIQISFNTEQSILRSIIEKQRPEIVKSPPNHPSYSERVDQLFNKFNQSFFAFPIEKNAMVMILRLEEPFNNEDFIVGQFFSNLMAPLFDFHVKSNFLNKQIEQRRSIREFEANLNDKVTFKLLIPYLFSFVSSEVQANDAKFFVVCDNKFIEIEIEDDQITQKKFSRCGFPEFIVKTKRFFMKEKLKSGSFRNYDDKIDNWSVGTCLAGFPIISDQEVIAVLLVSEKVGWNKFNKWDIEKLQTISNDISIVVQTCIKNDNLNNATSPHQNILLSFPKAVQSFTFEKIELNDSVEMIMKATQNLLNCDWLSIYSMVILKSSKIKRIATLHNGLLEDTEFLDHSFIKAAFLRKKAMRARDPSKEIEGFETVGNISPGDFLFSFCGEGKEKFGAFAMNTKVENGDHEFDRLSSEILSSLCNFVCYAIKIKEQNNLIADVKQQDMTITNAFSVCESIKKDKEPFQKLIDLLKQLLSMESYVVFRFNQPKNVFEPVFNSDDCIPKRTVGRNDPLAMQFDGLDGLVFIDDFLKSGYESSEVAGFFSSFRQILIEKIDDKQCVVIAFAGRNIASNYKLLFQYFSPLLKVFYKRFVLSSEVKFIESIELNSINIYKSKFTDDELASLSFDPSSMSDSQKDESVLLMFESLDLIKTIGTNVEQFARFLIKVRHSYFSEVPFHNYNHAVSSTQMMYVILKEIIKNDVVKLQASISASLMIAALLHDVSHEGFDSNFLNKSFSPLVFAHGTEATIEHFHVSTGASLIREFLIMKNDNSLALFWPVFVNSILATDDDSNDRFVADLKSKNKLDWKSEDDFILLSKVLLKIADASRCFRPFENCHRSSELLFEEKKKQKQAADENKIEIEELKKIDVYEIEFIDSVVDPLVQFLCKIDNKLTFLQEKIKNNRSSWSRFKG